MTDEQLRAIARRVHLSMPGMRVSDGEYWCKDIRFGIADAIDSNAVAILREEMDREWMAANHLDDDPTQTIVIDT